jgi:hypothetical protein
MNGLWSFRLKYPPTPEHAARLAELTAQAARMTSEADLDFSVHSLNQVDRTIRRMRREAADIGQVTTTLFGFGCYVGEVLVRNIGGQWRLTQDSPLRDLSRSPMVVELDEQQFCDPISKAFKRFLHAREDSLPHFYKVKTGTLPEEPVKPKNWWNRLRDG